MIASLNLTALFLAFFGASAALSWSGDKSEG
jgi:hypothetical protein